LERFGDTHLGVDWPKKEDVDTRYRVMLDLIKSDMATKIKLLDFGCGASHLHEYIIRNNLFNIEYSGLDLSEQFIELSRRKFPSTDYYCLDILDAEVDLPDFDYIVMNGVFTEKRDLLFDEMFEFFRAVVSRVFEKARAGIAFNVMSGQVDWERSDLFHLPFDLVASFLARNISRRFVFRHDYGLYEYTTYVYR
jgi:cyclopropane fatty-acyl-phospholipid synthase-like methyltransferase